MTFAATLFSLCVAVPCPQGDLRLPPPRSVAPETPEQRPLEEIDRFRRDLVDLSGPAPRVDSKLQDMGIAYKKIEPLILEVARQARPPEMANLMVAARRFGNTTGTSRVADELLFQLLSRPLGEATRVTVETMAFLKGAEAKKALQECVLGRISGVRRHATDVLVSMVTADDLEFALHLSSEQTLDLRLRGVDLLAAVPGERAKTRLVELLSKDPPLAAASTVALVRLGMAAVPALQRLCAEPVVDRGFAYAAFTLAQIEDSTGRPSLPGEIVKPLLAQLDSAESLTRSLAAVPLADLARRGVEAGGAMPDARIVEALIEVVTPLQFVPNLDMLRRPAEERLLRFTGRIIASAEALPWREWWKVQKDAFVGVRSRVSVDAAAAKFAVVSMRHGQRHVRLLAEGLADNPPVEGALEVLLSDTQMIDLVAALQAKGFGDPDTLRVNTALPPVRSLQVQVRNGRAQVAVPAGDYPAFDTMAQVVTERIESELWQAYRNPSTEPDRGAFWRAERRWLDANPDPVERGRRFARRIVQQWPALAAVPRARALEYVMAHPQRKQLLGEDDGIAAVAMLQKMPELGDLDLRLLELCAGVPGDKVWRECVGVAAVAKGGGPQAVRAVFAVLGTDAILAALGDERTVVRRAALSEVAVVRDQRAGARVVELLGDPDVGVRTAAAYACGQLQCAAAENPLVALIAADDTNPLLRRECLRALGRVGGDQAFAVLQRALAAPVREDKEAALRGLGELRDARAARLLAELAAIGHGKEIGDLARLYLLRQGGVLAVPALRAQIATVRDPAIRDQFVMLLGAYQDAATVPDLMDLLRNPKSSLEAATLLSGTTGVDVVNAEDRVGTAEKWWRQNKQLPQWQWFLDALRANDVATTLRPEQFQVEAGLASVSELSRLLVEAKAPRLRVLCAAVLRTVTNEDFGVVDVNTSDDVRAGIAARYRLLVETAKAAQGR
ncbi:MAG: HEAT repeat domain-containing protein [Planctomycetes bacterium]|nr:HEAT repeat domain-containing protein [Planctomycetota bacterium]